MRVVICIAAAVLSASQSLAEPRPIAFADLPDPVALTFEDPFRDMGFEMLEELRTVVRLEERLVGADAEMDTRARLEDRLAQARATLTAEGHDIEALLAERWVVAEKRKQAMIATNPDLEEAEVALVGYLIPAGNEDTGSPVGYLVPEIGMCSHMPAPPPNQLVRVKLSAPSPVNSPYAAVKITGRLHPRASDETIFILDGEVRMVSMWTLEATEAIAAEGQSSSAAMKAWQDALRSKYGRESN